MSPERYGECLKHYRSNKVRMAYLRSQMEMLERFLDKCTRDMVNDQVTMSQAITGMPHGSGIGDQTGRIAIDIASGEVTPFVKQIRAVIADVNREILRIGPQIRAVEISVKVLNEWEKTLMEMKMIDEYSWAEILDRMQSKFGKKHAKRSLQRALEGIFEKAYAIVR